jgi:hypothetical protein
MKKHQTQTHPMKTKKMQASMIVAKTTPKDMNNNYNTTCHMASGVCFLQTDENTLSLQEEQNA